MKKLSMRKFFLLGATLMIALFAACSKDNDTYDPVPQFNRDVDTIKAYLKNNNIQAIQDTASGIFYQITKEGNGVDSVKSTASKVKVFYTGRLLSGTVFDSTKTEPAEFTAGNLIVGFQFGLTKLSKGGKVTVYIPSFYGYGPSGNGRIPGNTVLIFDIELVDVTNPQQ